MYLTARFTVVSKRNVHWVVLKHRFNSGTFYYVNIGTYCCVFIKLLQEHIAAVQNLNIWGQLLKCMLSIVLEIFPTPNPTLNLSNIDKCKTDIKMCLLMQSCYLNFLICWFELFRRTLVTQFRNRAPRLTSTSPCSVSYRTNLPSMKTLRHQAGYVRW